MKKIIALSLVLSAVVVLGLSTGKASAAYDPYYGTQYTGSAAYGTQYSGSQYAYNPAMAYGGYAYNPASYNQAGAYYGSQYAAMPYYGQSGYYGGAYQQRPYDYAVASPYNYSNMYGYNGQYAGAYIPPVSARCRTNCPPKPCNTPIPYSGYGSVYSGYGPGSVWAY